MRRVIAFVVDLAALTAFVVTLLETWIVAIPTAVTARSLWVGSPSGWRFAMFLLVALGFTALFLLAGRLVLRLLGLGPPLGFVN